MKNKKGASTIISWVLLLGFAIGLATTVFLWTTRQTETMTESTVRFVEGGLQCENVMINVAVEDPCQLTIKNTRYLNIEKVILRNLDKVEDYVYPGPLNVQTSSDTIDKDGWVGDKIEVMPIVKVNDDLVGCKNKVITVNC